MAATAASLAFGSAATGTTAATAGLFGTAGSFSLLQTASTIGTLFSVTSTLQGGSAEQQIFEAQAAREDFQARQERLRGQAEGTEIKKQLARDIAAANARGGAAGIDISSGSPTDAVKQASIDASEAISQALINSDLAAEARLSQGRILRSRGQNAVRSSRSVARGIATEFLQNQGDRGVFQF